MVANPFAGGVNVDLGGLYPQRNTYYRLFRVANLM